MGRELSGAIAGFGQVAERAHAPALKITPPLKIRAVAEGVPARRQAASAAFPQAKVYESLDALLAAEKDLGFVIIATPPSSHGELALKALKAGCHVLCEKPLTLDLDLFESIRREATARRLSAYTVHNWAHAPQWKKIFEVVASGRLGELRHVELHALRAGPAAGAVPGDWRSDPSISGGGVLVDHGWHNFYLLHRLLPAVPARVAGRLGRATEGGVEFDAAVFCEYPEATALVYLTWRAGVRANTALLVGSKGLLELHDNVVVLRSSDSPEERFSFPEKLSAGSAHPEWMAGLLAEFAQAVEDPERRAEHLKEAGFCLRMINRVYAARHGRSPIREALTRPRERLA